MQINTRFSVQFAVDDEAMDALRNDVVDCAIGRFDIMPDDCRSQLLSNEPYAVVARRGSKSPTTPFDLNSYLASRHVLVSFTGGFHGTVDHALLGVERERQVIATVPHFLTAMAIAGSSDCVTTVPRRLAEYYGDAFNLSVYPPPFEIGEFSLIVATHRRRVNDLGLNWFIATLHQLWTAAQPRP